MTSLAAHTIEHFMPGEHPELFTHPVVFLSASVPFLKTRHAFETDAEWQEHQQHVSSADPDRIRDAVTHLARAFCRHRISLVFGAHPSISPLILEVVQEVVLPDTYRVFIFQSHHFDGMAPDKTLVLASWEHGRLLKTDVRISSHPDPKVRERESREWSLQHMREVMLKTPRLLGAVFIGGMKGVIDEANIFEQQCPGLPTFAYGSPGGAALDLLNAGRGHGIDPTLLRESRSYPLLAEKVLERLVSKKADAAAHSNSSS